jgi:hypothetical protein
LLIRPARRAVIDHVSPFMSEIAMGRMTQSRQEVDGYIGPHITHNSKRFRKGGVVGMAVMDAELEEHTSTRRERDDGGLHLRADNGMRLAELASILSGCSIRRALLAIRSVQGEDALTTLAAAISLVQRHPALTAVTPVALAREVAG